MTIDFRDIYDIEGSASLIFSMANTHGATSLIPGASTTVSPTKAAREWINGVKQHIGTMPAGNAMRAAGCLDLMHRLAYGKPADNSLLDTYRLAAFDSFVRGDSSVDRYILFNVVSSQVKQRNSKFLGKPLQWESLCIDRWHRQFRHGISIEELSDLDTIRRVTALLDSDLWAFETKNESRYKQTLFENHKHLLNNYQLSIINYQFLSALPSFLFASTPYLSPAEYTTYDTQIRTALYNHPATNRFQKASLAITLSN